MNIFNEIDRFFASLNNYINYNEILIIFLGLFIFSAIVVIISTSNSYEAKLIKAIDKFNHYFINNPNITEENLISFNNKMKSRSVPKQLRKQWQQFVLYREDKASHYMSFENCVAAPLRNSTFKRDVSVFNMFSYIIAFVCLLLNLYYSSYEGILISSAGNFSFDFSTFLQHVLLCPVIIIILNHLLTIMFNFRHNAIVDDLYQNYQYFEANIDKATETLPEYVDYEVLFDKNEIKRGIPILYIYLQRRAEEEKRELETARLKNVEHEKFNFDEAGVASSLVLDRAMQEAENYIAERKKLLQDIEQINAEITQEELNFRETTKEYQRQMQVSKETFDNFKAQLEDASSTIETNYIKKQQQQELDRQRNLERDYDTATDRHNKLLQDLQGEVETVDAQIKKAKTTLEKGMMSEFATYSEKVYAEAKKVAEGRQKEKIANLESNIKQLQEQIEATNAEYSNTYQAKPEPEPLTENTYSTQEQPTQQYEDTYQDEPVQQNEEEVEESEVPDQEYDSQEYDSTDDDQYDLVNENEQELDEHLLTDEELDENADIENTDEEDNDGLYEGNTELNEGENLNSDNSVQAHDIFTVQEDESKGVKKAGRPRKEKAETVKTSTGKRGRPKKVEALSTVNVPSKGRGRPKKENGTQLVMEETKKRGRPKKSASENAQPAIKKGRGRPKKTQQLTIAVEQKPTAKRGRPSKQESQPKPIKQGRGRPRKTENLVELKTSQTQSKRGRPKKELAETSQPTKKRGRPKKEVGSSSIKDIDAYLKEIDNQIAEENAKMQESERKLIKNSRIRNKRR